MSVKMHASVLCFGAISVGMPTFLKRGAAMLGQIEQGIHYGMVPDGEAQVLAGL
jgi:hypothetical protein